MNNIRKTEKSGLPYVLKTNNKIDKIDFNSGDGLKFDGVNDYVSIPHNASLNFQYTTPFSISAIIKPISLNSYNQYIVFNKIQGATIGYQILYLGGNKMRFWFKGGGDRLIEFTVPSLNNTFMVVCTSNGVNVNGMKSYVNGVLSAKTTYDIGLTSITNVSPIQLNWFNGFPGGKGVHFDVKVFNKELTQSEVTKLYQTQGQLIPATAQANLLADWRFEDKQGTVLRDRSGNNYNGTLTNFTNTTLGVNNAWVDKYGNSIQQL